MIDRHYLWPHGWGKQDVFFCRFAVDSPGETMPVGSSSIDFSRPLIRSKYDFPGKTSKITTTLNSHSPLASQVSRHLFSLGIVVLELALGKTVEDLYPNASWIMDFGNITDRNIEDLLESVKNKVNFHEEKAIISCMGLCPRLRIKSIIRNDVLPELYRTSTEMSHAPDQLEDSAKSYKVLHISLLHQYLFYLCLVEGVIKAILYFSTYLKTITETH
ncbi:Protein of unknown function [Pyronema omphalodes CBS 100304]|uniref:Uncharacterized protein n=1 Tax=Pyronema omphalodes (strain CBS 100304) TaxID=1076935 RepID=U4L0T6_PYROM|nr:Protein of unknown function [Pyronema omphalodes CBS 100304]